MKTRRCERARAAEPGRQPRGFTLVEMIVVMAILAILAAAAIPSFVRIAQMDSDRIDATSRLVYGMLNIARTHAATYRAETALYYTLIEVRDSRAGETDATFPAQVIADGVGVARRMTRMEVDQLKAQLDADGIDYASDPTFNEQRCFVVLDGQETRLQMFHPDAAVWAWIEGLHNVPLADQLLAETAETAQGLTHILLYRATEEDTDGDGELDAVTYERVYPRVLLEDENAKRAEPLNLALYDGVFPAHVFLSSGEMRVGETTAQVRYSVRVGHSPTAGVERRFLDADAYDYVEADADPNDDPDLPDVTVPHVLIELNQMTGRVRIVGDETAIAPPET